MTWNILHGGREPDPSNLGRLTEVIAAVRPDLLVSVETYGSGPTLTAALDAAAPAGVRYRGHRITQDVPGRDNLWIVHRFEPVREYLDPVEISTFHVGGLRLRDERGLEFDVFACWLNYLARHRVAIESEVAAMTAGRPRRYADEGLAALDEVTRDPLNPAPEEPVDRPAESRLAQARRILDVALPAFLSGPSSGSRGLPGQAYGEIPPVNAPGVPVILAGDFNCLSHRDWAPAHRDLPRHHGIAVPWRVTAAFERAGFRDAYREANPDVAAAPGGTRLAAAKPFAADYRIDYIWLRGGLRAQAAWTIDRRRAEHGPGGFYSDHAALVAELSVEPRAEPS